MSKDIDQKAADISDMVNKTQTEYRGNLFLAISTQLQKKGQHYTADLFHDLANVYGVKN
jgi:hypothetical protein